MVPETEWECPAEQALSVPPELQADMRYRFTVYLGDTNRLYGRCASWDALAGGALVLQRTLTDTSDRASGVLLKKRLTYRPSIIVAGAPVIVTELLAEERTPEPPAKTLR